MNLTEYLLTDICRPKQWPTISSQQMLSDGYPVFGANGVIGYYSEYNHEKPTLLITCRGATCGTLNISTPFSYVTGNAMALDDLDAERVDLQFLYYYLKKRTLRETITGTAQPQITRDSLKKVKVVVPPLDEQKRIAEVMDKADALRQKRRLALQKLDTLLQSVFLEMFGDPAMNQKDWDIVPFSEAVSETRLGLVRPSHEFGPEFDIPYIRMNSITRSGSLDLSTVLRTTASKAEIEENRLEQGDFLFNTRNSKELVGKTAIFEGEDDYVFNNNIMRIRFRRGFDPYFIHSQFQTDKIRHELEIRKSGTTNVFAIYYKNLQTVPIIIPPTELQEKYGQVVRTIRRQKTVFETSVEKIENLFESLQNRAFRGELFENLMPSVGFEPENASEKTSHA